jgi:hypothetical protein
MKIFDKVKKALEKIMKTASMSLEVETGCYHRNGGHNGNAS